MSATELPADQHGGSVDAVTAQVVFSRLLTICTEGMEAARQVSASPVVYAIGDVQTAILLPDGTPVVGSGGSGGAVFHDPVTATLEQCGDDPGIEEDDMFVLNDPWCGARHQPDVTIVGPVHYKGKLIAWVGSLCHHLDTGAMTPGGWVPGATEVYQEGYRFPAVKLVERGEVRSDLFRAIMNLVRSPDKVALDFRGQIAANNVIKRKLIEVCDQYGYENVAAVLSRNVERTREQFTERIEELPDGTFEQTVFLERNDGVERELLRCHLKLIKAGARLTLDFTGTSDQRYGPTNAALTNLEYWILPLYLRAALGPDIPLNMGVRYTFDLIAPEGSIVNPTPPAPVSAGNSISAAAVQGAFNKLLLCSESRREAVTGNFWTFASNMVMMGGTGRTGAPFTYTLMDGSHIMGSGGRFYGDGVDVSGPPIGHVALVNVEGHEFDNPILFSYRRLAIDSGGPGKFRGGVGMEEKWTPYETDEPLRVTIAAYGTEGPTNIGTSGGLAGVQNRAFVIDGDGAESHDTPQPSDSRVTSLPAATTGLELTPGRYLYVAGLGGGGLGDPFDRDPERVSNDVRAGAVSVEAARRLYGVVIKEGEVDEEATADLRDREWQRRLDVATVPSDDRCRDWGNAGERLLAIGENLEIRDGDTATVRCTQCGYVYCDAEHNHKLHAAVEETELTAGGMLRAVPELVARHFYCPGCAVQIWVDIVERGEPIPFDIRLDIQSLKASRSGADA